MDLQAFRGISMQFKALGHQGFLYFNEVCIKFFNAPGLP